MDTLKTFYSQRWNRSADQSEESFEIKTPSSSCKEQNVRTA